MTAKVSGGDRARPLSGRLRRTSAVAVVLALVAAILPFAPIGPETQPAAAQTPSLGVYKPVSPSRLHDVQVAAYGSVDLQVTGGTSGVPSPAQGTVAVAIDVTVVPTGTGWAWCGSRGRAGPIRPRPSTT